MKTYLTYLTEITKAQKEYQRTGSENIKNYIDNEEKVSYYETIGKYQDDEDVYYSFRSIDKIGINPNTQWGTPTGIYVYPAKQMYQDAVEDNIPSFSDPHDSPYIYIIKTRNKNAYWANRNTANTKVLSVDLCGGAGKKRLINCVGALVNYIIKNFTTLNPNLVCGFLESICAISLFYNRNTEYSGLTSLFSITHNKFSREQSLKNRDLDDYEEITKSQDAYKTIKDLLNTYSKQSSTYENFFTLLYYSLYKLNLPTETSLKILNAARLYLKKFCVIGSEQNNYTVMEIIWILTYKLANSKENITVGEKRDTDVHNPVKWNYLLRVVCGFDLITNKYGEKVIDKAEPTQGVFLSSKSYVVLEKVANKRHAYQDLDQIAFDQKMAALKSRNTKKQYNDKTDATYRKKCANFIKTHTDNEVFIRTMGIYPDTGNYSNLGETGRWEFYKEEYFDKISELISVKKYGKILIHDAIIDGSNLIAPKNTITIKNCKLCQQSQNTFDNCDIISNDMFSLFKLQTNVSGKQEFRKCNITITPDDFNAIVNEPYGIFINDVILKYNSDDPNDYIVHVKYTEYNIFKRNIGYCQLIGKHTLIFDFENEPTEKELYRYFNDVFLGFTNISKVIARQNGVDRIITRKEVEKYINEVDY